MNSLSARGRARTALAVFVLFPCFMGGVIHWVSPDLPDEAVIKWNLAVQHGKFDTVIAGDSRVMTIGGSAFESRGWNYFNMGLSGVSPEDLAIELRKVLLTEPVARVVVGLSFENMTERRPFEFSRYSEDLPFQDPGIREFVGRRYVPIPDRMAGFAYELLPVGKARDVSEYYRARLRGDASPPLFYPDGRADYTTIEARLAGHPLLGGEDPMDPAAWYSDPQNMAGYIAAGQLSPNALRLFSKILDDLHARGLPVLLFETARSERTQRMISDHPLLRRLQEQWRGFFRTRASGCIRFLEQKDIHQIFDQKDFFDPLHYLGATRDRVSLHLASELAAVEIECRGAPRKFGKEGHESN